MGSCPTSPSGSLNNPLPRALDRAAPSRVERLALVCRHPRLIPRRDRAALLEILCRAPELHAKTGERCRTECGRLADRRNLDRDGQQVRLELHEEGVRGPATVGAQHRERRRHGAHRVDEVARLERDALERRANDVRASRTALEADEEAARAWIPVRRAQSGERRHEVNVVVGLDAPRDRIGLLGTLDQPKTVTQPLHRRAGDECAALERVAQPLAGVPGDRREQSLRWWRGANAGVLEEEAAGAVRVVRLARRETRLSEARGLLIAREYGHRDGCAEM